MKTQKAEFGIIGLGVMGRGLMGNMERNGFRVAGFDLDETCRASALEQATDQGQSQVVTTLNALVCALETPRRILLLVPAGKPVDVVLGQLKPLLSKGDIIVDGGNSHFLDTQRRQKDLLLAGVHLIGMGISGGEEGALNGPSMMPGGDKTAYAAIKSILLKIAAKASEDQSACVDYMGSSGAGHFVKMVHNGIEYAEMQLIAECYDVLSRSQGLPAPEISEIFARWNKGEGASYLLGISADVLREIDPKTGSPVVDIILDTAGQKGTGRWTSQSALELGVAVPTITAGVDARILSAKKAERVHASSLLTSSVAMNYTNPTDLTGNLEIGNLEKALLAARIIVFAQGFDLLLTASTAYDYGLNLADIARIWRAGCILRSPILNNIADAFEAVDTPTNLLVLPWFQNRLADLVTPLADVVGGKATQNIPLPALMSAHAYYNTYRSERLPANLIQAQRDFFGAHAFERIDSPGIFHINWKNQQ